MHFKTHQPKKVLIINTFGIGDVLFTTPVISNLKASYPDVFIGYVCNRRTAELLEHNPKVDRVFVYERDAFHEVYKKSKIAFVKKIKGFLGEVKKEKFDLVLDVSMSQTVGFFTWLIGIKHRIGFDYKNRGMLLTQKVPLKGYEGKHVVEHYLSFLEQLGVPVLLKNLELTICQKDTEWAEDFIASKPVLSQGRPRIGLVPGGGASWGKDAAYKRWPAQKYAKLADKLIEKFSAVIILMGDKSERGLCEEVAGAMTDQPIMACGETSIGQFAALARKTKLMIVNDGGPLHVAVAAGARTASIFGPVDEHVYGPYPTENHLVLTNEIACRPCYRRFRRASCEHINCLNELNVDDVLERIEEIL